MKAYLFAFRNFIFLFQIIEKKSAKGQINQNHDSNKKEPGIFLVQMNPGKTSHLKSRVGVKGTDAETDLGT